MMNKGKGRATGAWQSDIIELSDSDEDEPPPLNLGSRRPQPSYKAPLENRMTGTASSLATKPSASASANSLGEPALGSPQKPPVAGPSSTPSPKVDSLEELISFVLEVIPDVDPQYVAELYLAYSAPAQAAVETPFSSYLGPIIGSLIDNPGYPKSNTINKRKRDENAAGPSSKKRKFDPARNVMKMDLLSAERAPVFSSDYYNLSLYWLGLQFPTIRKNFIVNSLERNRRLYAPTFVQLSKQLPNLPPTVLKKQQTRPLFNGPPWRSPEFDREYVWSLDWHPEKSSLIEWVEEANSNSTSDSLGQPAQEEKIESEESAPGEGIDCGCCFSEYVVSTMIQCPEGHLFCKACVLAFSQERLGQRNAKIKCMNQDDCTAEFGRAQLEQCLPEKLLDLYDRVKQDDEIAAACLDGLEECPFCDYKYVIENEMERLFRCLNEECGIITCRSCKKKEHLPKTCEEARDDSNLDAQHLIEEAMTNALMRKCPNAKCQATFVKTDGCNKITCAKCKQLSCYICRQPIQGYDHFNQMPGTSRASARSSTKCVLWDGPNGTNPNALEERHHDEVLKARDEALAILREKNPEIELDKIKVDAPERVRRQQLPKPNLPRIGMGLEALGPPPGGYPFAPAVFGQAPVQDPPPVFLPPVILGPGMPPIPRRNAVPWQEPRPACRCPRCMGLRG